VHKRSPAYSVAAGNVVEDVISVCVKLLVAAGKWQNSGRTPAAVVLAINFATRGQKNVMTG
jgi:hypothetical protein